MAGWQIPGVPSMPAMGDLTRMMQVQTEMLTELPETMAEMTRAVRGLAATVESSKDTVAAANRVLARLEALLDDLDGPVRDLGPAIERVTAVLESPVLQRLPGVLESVESTVLPITQSAERTRDKLAWVADHRHRVLDRLRDLTPTRGHRP